MQVSELTQRILFAVPAAALFLWVTYAGGIFFEGLIAIIAAAVIWEISGMMKAMETPVFVPVVAVLAGYVWFLTNIPREWTVAITLILLSGGFWAVAGKKSEAKKRFLASMFAGVYPTFGFLMIVQIRKLGVNMDGFWLTLAFFLMIWGNDVFAYFGGKTFGKHKLAPVISPNKTWEGFFFGFLGAAAGFAIAYSFTDHFPVPFWAIIPAILAVSILGPMGDITESRLKRLAGVKDSSRLLPGHGGFFDRFDSMILSAPFVYFIYYFML